MLVEFNINQKEKNEKKHWFQDEYFDLFVWFDTTNGKITSFQLCYDRGKQERVISWDYEKGFSHHNIDDGETSPHKNMTPVFIQYGRFAHHEVMPKFLQSSSQIDTTISYFIIQKLNEYINKNPHG